MRTIIATCAGLVALSAASVQAAPLPPAKPVSTELTISPPIELVFRPIHKIPKPWGAGGRDEARRGMNCNHPWRSFFRGRAAGPSHKRPSFAVRLFLFIAFRRSGNGSLSTSLWCSAVMGRCGTRTFSAIIRRSASLIPGWAGANSRFALVRDFAGKGLICLTVFSAKQRLREQNRRNSRFDGKNRKFCPQGAKSAVTQPPESGADCPVACRPPLRRQSPFIPVLSEWARALAAGLRSL